MHMHLSLLKAKVMAEREEDWFSGMNDKESISNHLCLHQHVHIYFDVTVWGGVFWPWRGAIANISLTRHDW